MSTTAKPVPRSAESLKTLLSQINTAAPKRSKASDGWIGDAAHASRKSDHNPDVDGTVDARDFTHDPANGVDIAKLFSALNRSRDRRISYVIANGQIFSGRMGPNAWVIRPYGGSNKHTKHLHISVLDQNQDDTAPWDIADAFTGSLVLTPANSVLKLGSKGELVGNLQRNLNTLGYGPLKVDEDFGKATEAAVMKLQIDKGLLVDGWAGPRTIEVIGKEITAKSLQPKVIKAEAKAAVAELKVDVAKPIIEKTANEGKVTMTEWLAGLTGVSTSVSVANEVASNVSNTTQSIGNIFTTLGPWLLLAFVVIGGAGYIIWDRRKRRLEANKIVGQL